MTMMLFCLLFLACFLRNSEAFVVTTTIAPQQAAPTTTLLFAGRNNRRNFNSRRVVEVRPTMNEDIQFDELRVVTPNPSSGRDEPLGIMSRQQAFDKAQELGGLDVILINDKSDPPVCKIVDYSKYRYSQEKKAKEIKKNSKANEIKEVKMSYKIDVHDYDVRKKNASRFLSQGNRVKCTVMFRGREMQHDKLGYELLDKLSEDLEALAVRDGKPKREGRNIGLILSPRPEVMKAVSEGRRAQEKDKKKRREAALKEKQATKEAAATTAATTAVTAASLASEGLNGADDDDDDDDVSLDELLTGDDLTKSLFT